jgi:hypothetical protein
MPQGAEPKDYLPLQTGKAEAPTDWRSRDLLCPCFTGKEHHERFDA